MRAQITRVYQLKISLLGIVPQIWRRVQVLDNTPLDELHLLLQIVMGWTNSHMHSFTFGDRSFTDGADPENLTELEMEGEAGVPLSRLISEPKQAFGYEYDFGDNWEHKVVLEKVLPVDPKIEYPVCTAGKRACPPEDCGGVWGYAEILTALKNPSNPEFEELLEWVGREYDPEVFDVESFAKNLRRLYSDR